MANNLTTDAGTGGPDLKTAEDTGESPAAHVGCTKIELGDRSTFNQYMDVGAGLEAGAALMTLPTDGTGRVGVRGDIAHDAVDSSQPILLGAHALGHGGSLTGVAVADITRLYANRHGILWTIGGHPDVITKTATVADADGAQTDTALVTVGAGNIAVVTRLAITTSAANSGNVSVKVGFGTATLTTPGPAGDTTILHEAKGMGAGQSVVIGNGSGAIGRGADDADIRYTCDDPVGGHVSISVSYYTIES